MISKEEKIKQIQVAIGTLPDGKPGPATYDTFYRFMSSIGKIDVKLPYEVQMFGCDCIIGDPNVLDAKNTKGNHAVISFPYSMSGSFTTVEGDGHRVPISILVSNGNIIRNDACHLAPWDGSKPETVLYYTYDGKHGKMLVKTAAELMKKVDNVKWAIGGGDINVFRFEEEGFTGKFSDVARYTAHNAIGFDRYGNIIGLYHKKCTLSSLRERCKSIGLVEAIFLDGGSISAINAGVLQRNIYLKQGYLISFK